MLRSGEECWQRGNGAGRDKLKLLLAWQQNSPAPGLLPLKDYSAYAAICLLSVLLPEQPHTLLLHLVSYHHVCILAYSDHPASGPWFSIPNAYGYIPPSPVLKCTATEFYAFVVVATATLRRVFQSPTSYTYATPHLHLLLPTPPQPPPPHHHPRLKPRPVRRHGRYPASPPAAMTACLCLASPSTTRPSAPTAVSTSSSTVPNSSFAFCPLNCRILCPSDYLETSARYGSAWGGERDGAR